MEPSDVEQCVEHMAAHPVLGPRYGRLIDQVPSAIRFALANEAITFNVFEELQGSTTRFLGAGMALCVSDHFVHELKTTPLFWVGPELVKRITCGKSPLLSPAEVGDANSAAGLNLLTWHLTCHPEVLRSGEVGTIIMTSYDHLYRGLRLREVIGQADCLEHLHGMRHAGGLYFDRFLGACENYPEVNVRNFSDEPHNCFMTRDLALTHAPSWISSLFLSYEPPRLSLSRSQARLLRAALDGETDEQLSDRLGISIHAVKMTWRMIYDRVAMCLPDLLSDSSRKDGEMRRRGKEKKQRLLDYVRKHPEELHPVSRKHLHQDTTQRTKSPSLLFRVG